MATNSGEVFQGGATTSQHIDAQDDDHFENTTFKLKRTRLLGLLDEFIDPEAQEKQIALHNKERDEAATTPTTRNTSTNLNTSTNTNTNTAPAQGAAAGTAASTSTTSLDAATSDSAPASTGSPDDGPSPPPFLRSPEMVPHDDLDLVVEPSRHVDYLSHHWDVDDISKSWRYVILRRKNVANAARLENASWRTWAQRRCNLRTISPEEVNWLKESDVTWLYGPIVDDDDHDAAEHTEHRAFNTASSVVAGDISIARKNHGPKPILKKRTVEDMMISHLNLLKLEIATARAEQEKRRREDAEAQRRRDDAARGAKGAAVPEYFDYNLILAKLNSQYRNYLQQSSTNNSTVNLAARNTEPSAEELHAQLEKVASAHPEKLELAMALLLQASLSVLSSLLAKEKRHIHFNDEVQQCIAIEEYLDDDDEYDDDEYDDDNDYDYGHSESYIYENGLAQYALDDSDEGNDDDDEDDDDDDDDEGGFFLRVRSPLSASMAGFAPPGLASTTAAKDAKENDASEDTESILTNNSKVYKTIHLLPPTMLNYGSSDEESDDSNPYTSSMSHNVDNSSSKRYDYYYDYNSVYEVDPNHAIYGTKKTPDVVDLPDNIALGSNFDYEIIENEDIGLYDRSPLVVGGTNQSTLPDQPRLPILSLEDSASPLVRPNPFLLEASDSSDSEDEGLSISAKSSSQSLAQQVFGAQGMTAAHPRAELHYPAEIQQREPEARHISAINPRYSSTELSKQPHSSSSLSDQFFSSGMTKAKDSALAELFFSTQSPARSPQPGSGTQSPPVQPKTSPLPPHTTSTNAFLGTLTPPLGRLTTKKSFIFDSEDESEDEFIENAKPPSSAPTTDKSAPSYASLYQVADRNGITAASADDDGLKKLSIANFLGSWNKGT